MKRNDEPTIIEHLKNINRNKPDDIFICCASFEERCISAVLKMDNDFQTRFSVIFVIEEPLYEKEIIDNLERINTELYKKTTGRIFTISCQRQDPLDGISQFKETWKYISKFISSRSPSTTLDISGFTKIYLLEILYYILVECDLAMPRIIHTTQTYLPTKLTKGVEEVVTMPSFVGEPSSEKETFLILFLGFEPERALTIWEYFYPLKTIALLTDPPRNGNLKYLKYAQDNNSYLLSRPSVKTGRVPADNAYEVKMILEDIWREVGDRFNIIIGPFGTKSQTIGVFLFWLEHGETQIVYSFPVEYTKSYLRRKPGHTLMVPVGI
jgi:hypothetical protein